MIKAPFSLDRVVNAVEQVHQRLLRCTAALQAAGVPYAVAGGNAVALWVARVEESAVRNTRDVDILIRRADLPAASTALQSAGFVYRHIAGMDVFLDGPDGKPRQGIHLVFAGEKVRSHEPAANPDVSESEIAGSNLPVGALSSASGAQYASFHVLSLPALVQIKLTAFRDKDRTHLRDLIDVGLLDATWLTRLPAPLADRLQQLLNDPHG